MKDSNADRGEPGAYPDNLFQFSIPFTDYRGTSYFEGLFGCFMMMTGCCNTLDLEHSYLKSLLVNTSCAYNYSVKYFSTVSAIN